MGTMTQRELMDILGERIRKVHAADKLTPNDLNIIDSEVRLAKQFTNGADVMLRTAKLASEHKSAEIDTLKKTIGV